VKGFTLIEILIAMLVFIIGVGSVFFVFTRFAEFLQNRFEVSCVVHSAYSAFDACSAGATPPSSLQCGNITVNVSATGCSLPQNSCGDISVSASYGSLSFSLSGKACKLGN